MCEFKMRSLAFILFVFFLAGCGGSGSNSGGDPKPPIDLEPQRYTVTFISNGGSSVIAKSAQQGDAISEPNAPTRTGNDFDGWFTDNNTFVNRVTFPYTVTGNINLYAKWTPHSYTVTFDSNDGDPVSPIETVHGNSISEPDAPTREGNDFNGWFTDNNTFMNGVTFPYTVTENITLYAKWTPSSYTVTFDSRGGSPVSSKGVAHGYTISAPTQPTRVCYDFEGWYNDSGLTTRFDFSTLITSNISLYANWSALSLEATCISSAAELFAIRNDLAGNYILGTDISLAAYGSWGSIGTYDMPFTGKVDGNGYKITGLTISNPYDYYVGLFGYVSGATITNLVLENIDIIGGAFSAGAIAGYVVDNSTISNIYSSGNVYSTVGSAGGIVGGVFDSTITNCNSAGNVYSPGGSSGGIAGRVSDSTITNCYSTGNVSSSSDHSSNSRSGGIVGEFVNSTIKGCYSTGDISSSSSTSTFAAEPYSGGIAGYVYNSEIIDSFSTGNISSFGYSSAESLSHSGGIAGGLYESTITKSYSTGDISSFSSSSSKNSYSTSGGIAGFVSGVTITDSYSTGDISSSSSSYIFSPFSFSSSGGIAGHVFNNGAITGCYSTGNISSDENFNSISYSGGITGYIYGNGLDNSALNNNAAINSNIMAENYAGRIVGFIADYVSVSNNFALDAMADDKSLVKFNTVDTRYYGINKTGADFEEKSTYSYGLGWKFGNNVDNPWKMPDGGGYPILYWQ